MSRRNIHRLSLVVLFGSALLGSLHADLTVGTAGPDYAKPFGDGTTTRYQQLYDSSDFSSALDIQGLGFFVDPSNFFSGADLTEYQVYLTDVALGTDLGATINTPPPLGTLLFDGVPSLSGSGFLSLMFPGAGFTYNPSTDGNLLLDVVRVAAPDSSLGFFLFADSTLASAFTDNVSCQTGCVYDGAHADPNDPTSTLPSLGLVTDFIEPATIPEPSSLAFLALALTALALMRRRSARTKN